MKEQAEVYRVGLLLGLFTLSEVIAWCDEIIQAEAEPDIAIIRASISGSKGVNEVAATLSEVEGEVEEYKVMKRLFRSMYDLVNEDRGQAARVASQIYRMVQDYGAPDDESESEMYRYYDAIDLALDGVYGKAEEVTDEMLKFLRKYST